MKVAHEVTISDSKNNPPQLRGKQGRVTEVLENGGYIIKLYQPVWIGEIKHQTLAVEASNLA